ncbi:MAG: hypothetical protein HYZ49_13465 [Chloroflexi bacterium]|nr:hypothetical protein [Chloroflexota bacterium]
MTTITTTPTKTTGLDTSQAKSLGGLGFDWLMAALGAWLIGGLYLDGWAHTHNPNLETFFTPWHGALYSGFLIQAAVLAGLFVRNLRRGHSFTAAMPSGYGLSLLGAAIFMVGGVGDMIWHILFGIEIGVEALLSPTHLMLAFGGVLLITGPLRAGLKRANDASWLSYFPFLISATLLFSILTFFTDYASPLGGTWITSVDRPGQGYVFVTQALGITAFLFQSALLTAIVLVLIRNHKLRPGALTFMLTINSALMVVMHDIFFGANPALLFVTGVLAGVAADVLVWRLKPSIINIRALRLFSAALPAILYLFYFLAALFTVGLWWSIHLWTGAVVLCGVMGWLVSYLVVPSNVEKVSLFE